MSGCKLYAVPSTRFAQSQLSSTTAVNTQPAWVNGTTYALGDRVLWSAAPASGWMKGVPMLRVFESLASSNTANPAEDATKWLNIGPANTVAMFTTRLAEVTTAPDLLAVSVSPMQVVTCCAFFGLVGDSITLTVRSIDGGVRSTETRTLIRRPAVVDWFTFFLAPYEQATQALFLPITCLPGDLLEVAIVGPTAACARMVYGQLTEVGNTPNFGAGWSMDNYTSADEDEFGFIDPELGDYAPRNAITAMVNKGRTNATISTLIALRGQPSLLVGSRDPDYLNALVNFGLFRDPQVVIESPSYGVLSFEFKGFV